MAGRKSDEELLVITKMYDFILWSCNHTSKFPRNHRFVLGERIERNLYDLLESLIEAKYSRARTPLLQKANLRLEILRFQMRLATDLQCLRVESYACRRGKGTHAAVHRCQEFSRQYRYVLKADIRKFFPTMDHQILKDRIARKIKDPDVMWLVGEIIDGSNPQEVVPQLFPGDTLFTSFERRRGIPIGNQTSQFFSNVYLDALDHFVKDRLGMKGYVRYVDDFLVR